MFVASNYRRDEPLVGEIVAGSNPAFERALQAVTSDLQTAATPLDVERLADGSPAPTRSWAPTEGSRPGPRPPGAPASPCDYWPTACLSGRSKRISTGRGTGHCSVTPGPARTLCRS